jgi:hypothetical protein
MGDFLGELLDRLLSVLRPDSWVDRSSGLIIAALLALTSWLISYELRLEWYLQCLIPLAGFPLFLLLWFLARELYWRRGKGRKIGICYEGFKVPIEDWVKTRQELRKLFRANQLTRKISLRHIPSSHIENQEIWERTERKYGFDSVFRIQVSAPAEEGGKPTYGVELRAKFRSNLRHEFIQKTLHFMRVLIADRPTVPGLAELLKYRAEGLFNSLLLHLGVMDYADDRLHDAITFLAVLDKRLERRFGRDVEPRRTVRMVEYLAMCQPSGFLPEAVPEPEELLEAIRMADEALAKFGDEFPQIWNAQARNQFFNKNLDEALRLTEEGLKRPAPKPVRVNALLNRGVIQLFLANWFRAEQSLRECLATGYFKADDWRGLISFADFAREFGEENAIYLQCLYRELAGETIPPELHSEFTRWLDGDESRDNLRFLFNDMQRKGASAAVLNVSRAATRKGKNKKAKNKKR